MTIIPSELKEKELKSVTQSKFCMTGDNVNALRTNYPKAILMSYYSYYPDKPQESTTEHCIHIHMLLGKLFKNEPIMNGFTVTIFLKWPKHGQARNRNISDFKKVIWQGDGWQMAQ